MTTTIGSLDLTSQSALYDETQYFWFESSSSSAWGAGAHVTLYPESEFTNSSSTNYLKGQNILMNTDGFSIRNELLPMMVLDNDSLDFNLINEINSAYETVANFTNSGLYFSARDGQKVFTVDCDTTPTTETIVIRVGRAERLISAGVTKTYNINRVVVADNGTSLTLQIQTGTSTPVNLAITKGVAVSEQQFGTREVYLTYDGNITFTIDNRSSSDYNLNRISFNKTWYEVLETIRGNALIDGDATISDSLNVYGDTNLNGDIYVDGVLVSNGTWYLETRKQLWKNNSPTSTFAAKTILENNTDLAKCDEVRIYYRHSTTDDRIYCVTGDVGTKVPLTVQGMEYNRTGGRIATINSSGIVFGAASYNTNTNNTYAVPTKIIGVKHA